MTLIRKLLDHELPQLGRLRYDIYVAEMRRPQRYADHDARSIIDPLDNTGINLVAEHDGRFVGTVRLNLCRDGNLDEYAEFYGIDTSPAHWNAASICTRFMVLPRYRGTRVALELARAVYRVGLHMGVEWNYCDCNDHLVNFFSRLGYEFMHRGQHDEYGDVSCMLLALRQRDHLSALESPFLPDLDAYDNRNPPKRAQPTEPASSQETLMTEIRDAFEDARVEFMASAPLVRLASGNMSVDHYKSILREIYYYSREDPQIQALAAVYFRGPDRDLVQPFLRHALAEVGHDTLALNDLAVLGDDVSEVPQRTPLATTMGLIAFPFYQINYGNPIGYLGYLYFLEHLPTSASEAIGGALSSAGIPEKRHDLSA